MATDRRTIWEYETPRPRAVDDGVPTESGFLWPYVAWNATESVRCRPRTTRGGEPAMVPTAITRIPMGPV